MSPKVPSLHYEKIIRALRQVMFGCDLVGALAHALVPDRDLLNRDPASGNTRLAARDSGRDLDVVV